MKPGVELTKSSMETDHISIVELSKLQQWSAFECLRLGWLPNTDDQGRGSVDYRREAVPIGAG